MCIICYKGACLYYLYNTLIAIFEQHFIHHFKDNELFFYILK